MADRHNLISVDNETRSSTTRVTADNRRVTYNMKVLQQPLRARACGSGAKSSADRRPVDPPPIVELKVLEGPGDGHSNEDVTLSMNANYFLYAMLEQARPIAQGRIPDDKTRAIALTGSPVAGMVYLDRPTPAGYFIFPDLSVRHEGKYRLSFSLYEEMKNSHDVSKLDDTSSPLQTSEPRFVHRLEVKSEPFMVYSAKKFPGLTESTSLSRMVAEQGCRVRIRRDVRMRKRESKQGKEWDDHENDTASARRMSATPDINHYAAVGFSDCTIRPRSMSDASHHSVITSASHRQLNNELVVQQTLQHVPSSHRTSHIGLVQSSPSASNAAQIYNSMAFAVPQTVSMQPPSSTFCNGQLPYQQPHLSNSSPAFSSSSAISHFHGFPTFPQAQTQATHYGSTASFSVAQQAPPRPNADTQTVAQHACHPVVGLPSSSATAPHNFSAFQDSVALMPVSDLQYPSQAGLTYHMPTTNRRTHAVCQESKPRSVAPSTNTVQESASSRTFHQLPPLQIPGALCKSDDHVQPDSTEININSCIGDDSSNKRTFASVFNDRHHIQPLRGGARPSSPYQSDQPTGVCAVDLSADDADTASDLDPLQMPMRYRRADGSSIVRSLPPHN